MASTQFAQALRDAAGKMQADAKKERYKTDPVLWAEEVAEAVLWSKQKEILRSVAANKRTAVKSCHSIGKLLPLGEWLPTPTGFRQLGDITPGDYVYGPDGKPTLVTFESEVQYVDMYRMTFNDGTSILTAGEHLWQVQDLTTRPRKVKDWREHWDSTVTMDTDSILAAGLKTFGGQFRWRIPTTSPLEGPGRDLSVDPYVLGLWLGDGGQSVSALYGNKTTKAFYQECLESQGYEVSARRQHVELDGDNYAYHATGLLKDIRRVVPEGKRIPNDYLWGTTVEQRKALLAGIMDSDGFHGVGGSSGFDTTDRALAEDVKTLLGTLGVKVNIREGEAAYTKDGERTVTGTRYRLAFTTGFKPFRNRGEGWEEPKTSRHTIRTIVSIEPTPTVASKCISVDNERKLYVAGKDFIPTHNTFISAIAAAWWIDTRYNSMVQSTAPTYKQVHGQLWEEIRKLHTRAGLVGTINNNDEWKREMVSPSTGRTQNILVGQGSKPADNNIHGFHGIHRPDGVLTLLDEGCGLHQSLFTGAEAITTAEHDRQLTTGNPDDPATEFGEIFAHKSGQWNLITISAFDTPNFTGEADELRAKYKNDPEKLEKVENMLRGLPQPEVIEEQKELWGEDSPRYLSKVLAQFPLVSEDSLFTPAEIATGVSCELTPEDNAFKVLGVDPARYGNDKAAIVLNTEGKIEIVATYNTMDLMELAARVHKHAIDLEVDQVRVDSIGVGGGVADRLTQLSIGAGRPYAVIEMVASARAPDPSLHRNTRAYWYDSFKYKLRSGNIDLPDSRDIINEMSRVRYEYPNGVMKIESKEDMRKRGVHSPDILDAAVMAAAPIVPVENNPLASARPGQMAMLDMMPLITSVSPY